ncbi:MAG: T9SS type A sorting domain-containing protein [bacterium]|nr:T9SS type A sorting domain-containing protein [bacterium]
MDSDFHIWTYAFDHSGLERVELMVREDIDGVNGPSNDNETYAGGADVGSWSSITMNLSIMPMDEPWEMGGVDFTVLPYTIANKYWVELIDYENILLDYYIEAEDVNGNIKRSPIQHVYVGENSGSSSSGFVMDGEQDDAPLVASGDYLTLRVTRDENLLYVSVPGVGQTNNVDHFIVITDGSGVDRVAPWAKAGLFHDWDYFLAAENDNYWCGWFDTYETVQSGAAFASAHGTVLEGVLDLELLYGGSVPEELYIAAASYSTEDGGDLKDQAPVGNGDGNVSIDEFYLLTDISGVDTPVQFSKISLHPNPFNPEVIIKLTLPEASEIELSVYDTAGRLVRTLNHYASTPGVSLLHWDGTDNNGASCPSGVYLFKANGNLVTRGTLVK